MKTITIIFLQLLLGSYCLAQDIDQRALKIMQMSFDKLAGLKTIKYNMTFADSTQRGPGPMVAKQVSVTGIIEKNSYWHVLFEDNSRWLIKGDTLFKRLQTNPNAVSYTQDWHSHELAEFSIYNILGSDRPMIDEKHTASLKFVQDTSLGEFYVIDEMSTKRDFQTDEIQDVSHGNRYWIDKQSLMPVRRKMYSERLENGKQSINIYDFTVSIDQVNQDDYQDVSVFFDGVTVMEKVGRPEELKIGSLAPMFAATDLKTNKLVTLNDLKGKVVLLDFWYLSCMPCRILTPKIQKLHEKFVGQDVAVVGINVVDTASRDIMALVKEKMITFPQYYKTGNLSEAYKLYAYPTTMVIGKDGKIKLLEIGLSDDTDKKLEQAIKQELMVPAYSKSKK